MAVLLQFNVAKQHSVEYLQEVTRLQDDVLRQVLQILLRIKLLVSSGVKGQGSEWLVAQGPMHAVSYLPASDV